jgi:hypothetical protein
LTSVLRFSALGSAHEADVISDHHPGPDRNELRLRYVQLSKFNPAAPHFAQEVLEDLNRELLGWTAAVSEAEWRKARMVADRQRLSMHNRINRAKAAVVERDIATVLHLEGCSVKRTFGKASLRADGFIDLMAGRRIFEAIRIETFRPLPMRRK